MPIQQRIFTTLGLGLVIIGLTAVSTQHTTRSQAQQEEPRVRRAGRARASLYGLQELTRGQTARLSVVKAGLSGPGDERPPRVTLAFDIYEANPPEPVQTAAADGSVHTLRFLRRVSHTLVLRTGEAASFEFDASRAGETIAAWVLATPPEPIDPGEVNPPDIGRPAVVTSLEVRQGNRTQFVLPAVRQGFDPQPEPPVHR
ncbi:MAG: hypothetical protein ND895_00795 [Pyrinomonadaceae bacterium]|nr:hypothetical protein [Pyrinomonadaceae bacterium]